MWSRIRNATVLIFAAAMWVVAIWYGYRVLWSEPARGNTLRYLLWALLLAVGVALVAGAWVCHNIRLARRARGRRRQAIEREVNREHEVLGRTLVAESSWEALSAEPVVEVWIVGNEKRYAARRSQ